MKLKDKKITILEKGLISDGEGGFIEGWAPIPGGENVWAYYRQTSGKELFEAATVNAKEEVVFEINWRKDIDTTMRIEFRGRQYQITRIDDFEGYKEGLKIYAYVIIE